jgi:hypothetical protein
VASVTNIIESLIEDGLAWLPKVALLVAAFMVLATWVKTRRAGPTLMALLLAVLVVGFVTDQGGFATLVMDELKSRSAS